jgi:hypothetical protein
MARCMAAHLHSGMRACMQARGGGDPSAVGGGGGGKVVERVVEVEGDVEAVKAQLRRELEEKMMAVSPG